MLNENLAAVLKIIITVLFTAVITKKMMKLFLPFMKSAGCTMKNYRGSDVVFGMGAVFIPIIITSSFIFMLLFKKEFSNYISYLFAVCIMGFAGLLDDLIGVRHIKGLRNHIASFFKGYLTTGFIKAFLGLTSSLILSLQISGNLLDFIINILNISLFTNALNIFDLRPGRTIKIFLLLGSILVISNLDILSVLLPLVVILTATAIYFKFDLRELCMLGDTGSNILGITLGYFSSIAFDTGVKSVIFILLLSINIAAERVSLTKLISKNRLLNYLDNLGRSSGT